MNGHPACVALLEAVESGAPPATELDPTLEQQEVILVGLSQPDLNGRIGTVVSLNHERGRYAVKLAGDEKVVSVLPSKVELAATDPAPKPAPEAKPHVTSALGDQLVEAAFHGDMAQLKRLLKSKTLDVDYIYMDWSALHQAAARGHVGAVRLLLKAKTPRRSRAG